MLTLTARDSLHAIVKGMDAGADDYLTKPFSFLELLTRIRALARRTILAGKTFWKCRIWCWTRAGAKTMGFDAKAGNLFVPTSENGAMQVLVFATGH